MSLYGDYIKEHRGDEIIESSIGFASYRFLSSTSVYIIDIYVKPEHRKSHAAAQLADIVCIKAKERGCLEVLGSVVPHANNSEASMKVLLAYGMKPDSIKDNMVIFKKEL